MGGSLVVFEGASGFRLPDRLRRTMTVFCAVSREISHIDQYVNLNKSKLKTRRFSFWLVLATLLVLGVAFAASASGLKPPLTGRLQPWLVPGVLAGLLILAILGAAWSGRTELPALIDQSCSASHPATSRALIATLAPIIILALGVRSAGLVLTVWLAGSVAVFGIDGIKLRRAVAIGAALAVGSALLFAGLLRVPLPLLPGGMMLALPSGFGW
jgi:Tripartite tricarboxylate transporter TctB family